MHVLIREVPDNQWQAPDSGDRPFKLIVSVGDGGASGGKGRTLGARLGTRDILGKLAADHLRQYLKTAPVTGRLTV